MKLKKKNLINQFERKNKKNEKVKIQQMAIDMTWLNNRLLFGACVNTYFG